jgi:RNA polymerase sigma-70 factor (ECF subfamily)
MNTLPMSPEDTDGPADARSGTAVEERAFRAMVVEHAPHLRRVLRSLGVPAPDLDDVCQEVFIVAHRRLDAFEGRSSLRTWLCGIAIRVASDYRGKAYRRRELPTAAPPPQTQKAEQESSLERKRAWQLIEELLGEMSPEHREAFVLYEIAELSVPEAARAIGCPAPTAYSRLYAAREQISRRLAQLKSKERVQ